MALEREPWFVSGIALGHLTAARLSVLAVSLNPGTQHDDLSGLLRVYSLDEADELTVYGQRCQIMIDGDEGSHDSAQVERGSCTIQKWN